MSIFTKAAFFIAAALLSFSFAVNPPEWGAELIFDDFNDVYGDPINRSCLGAVRSYSEFQKYTKGTFGYWYTYSSSAAKITNPGGTKLTSSNIKSAFDTENKCMHFMLDMSGADEGDYAAMACNLLAEGDWVDLSKLTGIYLKIKGEGSVRMALKSKYIKDNYEWGEVGYMIETIPTAWSAVSLTLDDLVPQEWSDAETDGVTWDDVKTEITAIEFAAATLDGELIDADVWIDSIVFKGMVYSDLVTEVPVFTQNVAHVAQNGFSIKNNVITYTLPRQDNVEFSIVDLQGNLVHRLNNVATTSGTHTLIVPELSNGNYLVKMHNTGGVRTKKFSVVK